MASNAVVAQKGRGNIIKLVDGQRDQIEAALPPGADMDRLMRMMRTALATNETLARCEPVSVLGAFIETAQLGLEPGITAHLVPFYDSKSKQYRAQLIADYRGLIQLAVRSGHVLSVTADLIREGDEFTIERGTEQRLIHHPRLANDGAILAAYAVAQLKDGAVQFEVVDRVSLDEVRKAVLSRIRSEGAKKASPWYAPPTMHEMQKKTAIRRLCKYLPFATVDSSLVRAIVLDELADRGDQKLTFEANPNADVEHADAVRAALEAPAVEATEDDQGDDSKFGQEAEG